MTCPYILRMFVCAFAIINIAHAEPARATRRNQPKIFLACIPKSGTHLLRKAVGGMGRSDFSLPGSLLAPTIRAGGNRHSSMLTHAVYNAEDAQSLLESGFKILFMMRDPRDQAVSFIYFSEKNAKAWPALSSLPFEQALTKWITDTSTMHSTTWGRFSAPVAQTFKDVSDFYSRYQGWMSHPNVYTVHFERLVGEQGGGSREAQIEELTNIVKYLEIDLPDERITSIADTLFGRSRTFRSGQIGSWKTHFTPEQKELFKKIAEQLLIDLGYEKDFNW